MVGDEVTSALDALPLDFKMVVLLVDLEELSYKEVAEILDCPVGTVMSRLHRGRKLLRGELLNYAVEHGIVRLPKPDSHTVTNLAEFRRKSEVKLG